MHLQSVHFLLQELQLHSSVPVRAVETEGCSIGIGIVGVPLLQQFRIVLPLAHPLVHLLLHALSTDLQLLLGLLQSGRLQ